MEKRNCKLCGEEFTPLHHQTLYCSPECKKAAHHQQLQNARYSLSDANKKKGVRLMAQGRGGAQVVL
jgi:hypothetical protein